LCLKAQLRLGLFEEGASPPQGVSTREDRELRRNGANGRPSVQIRENKAKSATSSLRCIRPARSQPADPLAETPFRVAFFLGYPELLDAKKVNAVRSQLGFVARESKVNAVRSKLVKTRPDDVRIAIRAALVPKVDSGWKASVLHANLSWRHYWALLRVKRRDARDDYAAAVVLEPLKSSWSFHRSPARLPEQDDR
jgi:hypothetical protein